MTVDEKKSVLAKHLAEFRKWSYEALVAEIDRTRKAHDCLLSTEGVFEDDTEYAIEVNVYWDDKTGGDVRVIADLTTPSPVQQGKFSVFSTPDVMDGFIMKRDGCFVDE